MKSKINPLTAFANPANPRQNPSLNPKPMSEQTPLKEKQKAVKLLGRAMKGAKR